MPICHGPWSHWKSKSVDRSDGFFFLCRGSRLVVHLLLWWTRSSYQVQLCKPSQNCVTFFFNTHTQKQPWGVQTSCHWLRPAGRLALRPASRSRVASKAATHEVKREAARLPQRTATTAATGSVFPMGTETCERKFSGRKRRAPAPASTVPAPPGKGSQKATLSPPQPLRRPSLASLARPSPPSPVTPGHRLPSPPLSTQLSSYPPPPPRILCVSLAYLPPLRCNPTADPGSTRKCPRILVSSAWSLLGCTKFGLFRWGGGLRSFQLQLLFACFLVGFVPQI